MEEKVDACVKKHPELSEDELVEKLRDPVFLMDEEDIRYRIRMIRGT